MTLKLTNPSADIFVPNGITPEQALVRTTHIAIGAHQDDLEVMALAGILECFQSRDKAFTGVVVTNGAGSPRTGIYDTTNDIEMQAIRRGEQRKAAVVGEYACQLQLDFSSAAVKDPDNNSVIADLTTIFTATRPKVVYTHNLADTHDTHVAVALRVIAALRTFPANERPKALYGCEVWRDLDWLADNERVAMDVSRHTNLSAALLGVFDSQIAGGKRYDLAAQGRRRANATFASSHGVDTAEQVINAMDLTPLLHDEKINPAEFVAAAISRFNNDVTDRISKFNTK